MGETVARDIHITLPHNLMMKWRRENENEFVVIAAVFKVKSGRVTTLSIIFRWIRCTKEDPNNFRPIFVWCGSICVVRMMFGQFEPYSIAHDPHNWIHFVNKFHWMVSSHSRRYALRTPLPLVVLHRERRLRRRRLHEFLCAAGEMNNLILHVVTTIVDSGKCALLFHVQMEIVAPSAMQMHGHRERRPTADGRQR